MTTVHYSIDVKHNKYLMIQFNRMRTTAWFTKQISFDSVQLKNSIRFHLFCK